MRKKPTYVSGTKKTPLYERIRQILESARSSVARTVNTTQVVANWLIGREIVEEEQKGKRRAEYAEQLLLDLSARLTAEYGRGTLSITLSSSAGSSWNTTACLGPRNPTHCVGFQPRPTFPTQCVGNPWRASQSCRLKNNTRRVVNPGNLVNSI
jgi:hypothetical protein